MTGCQAALLILGYSEDSEGGEILEHELSRNVRWWKSSRYS